MSIYTTGELAKLCEVSVRTVQFYDAKGLLHPTALTEGGRRLYSGDDLKILSLICTLKAMGLKLDSIRGILKSDTQGKVLSLLLDEQLKQLESELKEKQKQIETVKTVKRNIKHLEVVPVNLIHDIDYMMENKRGLRKVYAMMLIVGIALDVVQIGTIALWIVKGIWWPFALAMPFILLSAALLVRMYYRNTQYVCAQCNAVFKPVFKQFFFARHTPKTRKLTCKECGYMGYCVEIFAKKS